MFMKCWNRIPVLPVALAAFWALGGAVLAQDQQGPDKDQDQTVAKPRKATDDTETAPIPSKLSKKAQPDVDTTNLPSFQSAVNLVSVDVAVLDNKGHFIPNIPRGSFRVLEDNVPQQIKSFGKSTAPMTVCPVSYTHLDVYKRQMPFCCGRSRTTIPTGWPCCFPEIRRVSCMKAGCRC